MAAHLAVVVLAAGKGTRMRSTLPKVLHPLGGRTILEQVLHNLRGLTCQHCIVVVGYGADRVRAQIDQPDITFAEQTEQLGTGHAVQQVMPLLTDFSGHVLVLNGDAPLLRPATLERLVTTHVQSGAEATILTARLADPTGYGRVSLDAEGRVLQVIEHRDCTSEQELNTLVNAGIYCYRWERLAEVLPALKADNDQAELYLPDTLMQLANVAQVEVDDPTEVLGINDRLQLAEAGRVLNTRTLERLMQSGVTIVDPASVTVDDTVEVAADVIIEPQTHLRGQTRIATGCRIGPGTLIEDSVLDAGVTVLYSVLHGARVGVLSRVGPYAHLRSESVIGKGCRIGNFVEIKKATVGNGSAAAHLSYLGDATLGERVNIGAGTIIANYDGKHKHHTHLGDDVKTGANSVLVAPLSLGDGVNVAAGSTVTEDVPQGLVIARPRQVVKPEWRPNYESG